MATVLAENLAETRDRPKPRGFTDHVYYSMTKSLCAQCKRAVDAKIIFRDKQVFLDKFCPGHGKQEVMISSSVDWYLDALSFLSPADPPEDRRKVELGCPFDCGPCASHQQKVAMPVVPITSACNLDCPICYTVNKNEGAHHMSKEEFQTLLDNLLKQHHELDIINFTGGEPTVHPHFVELLEMARAAGIERLTVSTNGLKLLDEDYLRRVAALDARIVLSLDTFRREVDEKLLGANTVKAKLKLLDMLEAHDVSTTILPAVAAGYNDDEVGQLWDLVVKRPNVISLEMHTLTFTGQGGVGFDRNARITTPDLQRRIQEHTDGRIVPNDFVPSPLAHPHCYSICYVLLIEGGTYVPFARFIPRNTVYDLLQDSLYLEPRERTEQVLREAIDRLWVDPDTLPESEAVLAALKRLVGNLYPSDRPALSLRERRRAAERAVKCIYIHSHMDEESFDVARVMKCSIGVPLADGGNIPTCSYNVIYRERDPRFAEPETLQRMDEGRKRSLPVLR